jgi:hypothetical protein
VRRIGMKDVPLPGQVYSPEYMRAYEAAIAAAAPLELGAKRTIAGSVDMAVVSYYASREFADLAPGTQCNRRSVLERFRAEHGSKRIGLMDTRALQAITGKLTGANQRNFKKALRGLVDHCLAKGWIKVDPPRRAQARQAENRRTPHLGRNGDRAISRAPRTENAGAPRARALATDRRR